LPIFMMGADLQTLNRHVDKKVQLECVYGKMFLNTTRERGYI
jgi:hypothetical protein